jgi:hypothetical protein
MGRPKIWFELGRYADFTLYGHKDLTGSFELIRSPRKDGIPNPKRRFVFDWNEKRWRLAASRDIRILSKYHPEIKAWVTYTLGNALECRSMLAIIGAVAGAPALKDWPVMVDA